MKKKPFILLFQFILVTVIVLLILGYWSYKDFARTQRTKDELSKAAYDIIAGCKENQRPSLRSNYRDGWDNPILVIREKESTFVVSSGFDGEFGTNDDKQLAVDQDSCGKRFLTAQEWESLQRKLRQKTASN